VLLKWKKYCVIATIEAKNTKQAREIFLKDYIIKSDDNFQKNIFVKI
jgi:hypothetical protein